MISNIINKTVRLIAGTGIRTFMRICWIVPIKKNKVVADNFYGRGYGDSPKYIVDQLLALNSDFDIVWLLKNKNDCSDIPNGVRTVNFLSLRGFYELATAKFWIDNVRKLEFNIKRKNQYYIQTWHGCIALKQIEGDVEDHLPRDYVRYAKRDSRMIDLVLSNSKMFSDLVRRSFWYEGEIFEEGLPRNDIFIKDGTEIRDKVRKQYSIREEQKIVFYAPTFRNDSDVKVMQEFTQLLESLKKKFQGDWVLLLRLHPNDASKLNNFTETFTVKNAMAYPDIQELLVASDVLITDYSSTMFEFAIMKKPVFLYVYDLDEYIQDRNFYFDINKLPFMKAKSEQELYEQILQFNESIYYGNLKIFFDSIGLKEDGKSSVKVVQRMLAERERG